MKNVFEALPQIQKCLFFSCSFKLILIFYISLDLPFPTHICLVLRKNCNHLRVSPEYFEIVIRMISLNSIYFRWIYFLQIRLFSVKVWAYGLAIYRKSCVVFFCSSYFVQSSCLRSLTAVRVRVVMSWMSSTKYRIGITSGTLALTTNDPQVNDY